MNALSPDDRAKLQKLIALLGSDQDGERAAALAFATQLLDRNGIKWCEVLSLPAPPAAPVKREPLHSTWRATCAELAKRPGDLRVWERRFICDLPAFPRISTKQRHVLDEIAHRVLHPERAA